MNYATVQALVDSTRYTLEGVWKECMLEASKEDVDATKAAALEWIQEWDSLDKPCPTWARAQWAPLQLNSEETNKTSLPLKRGSREH